MVVNGGAVDDLIVRYGRFFSFFFVSFPFCFLVAYFTLQRVCIVKTRLLQHAVSSWFINFSTARRIDER